MGESQEGRKEFNNTDWRAFLLPGAGLEEWYLEETEPELLRHLCYSSIHSSL